MNPPNLHPQTFKCAPAVERVPLVDNARDEDNDEGRDYYTRRSHETSIQATAMILYMVAGMVSAWLVSIIPTPVMVLGGAVGGFFLGALLMGGKGPTR